MATFNIVRTGFRWAGTRSPGTGSRPIIIKPVATAYGTALTRGLPVKLVSDGTIAAASAGDNIYGIMDGAEQYYDSSAGVMRKGGQIPASVSWGSVQARQTLARVIPVRGQVFLCQADDATTATTLSAYQDMVQENVEWVAGTAVGDQAGCLLDISGNATTNTLSVRILDIANPSFTDFANLGVDIVCAFNLIQDETNSATGV